MVSRLPLPNGFAAEPFHVRDALAAGVTQRRLRGDDLSAPFYAVRSVGTPSSLDERCAAYLPRMRAGNAFSHVTAAALWGVPLPETTSHTAVHVSCPFPGRAPSGRGVVGHRWRLDGSDVGMIGALPVTSPSITWVQLSASMSWTELVVTADYFVTGRPFDNILPLASLDDLRGAHRAAGDSRGAVARRRALEFASDGPFSRPESQVGILFRLGGLPQPLVNSAVHDSRGSFLALPDAIWEEYRVAFEYEGDHHRRQGQFRRDVQRVERLVDHGWIVVRATARDLYAEPMELLDRVARRLRSRGWGGRRRQLRNFAGFTP